MVEKTIKLENVQLLEFLGVENQNIKEIAAAFPESRIISRGNEIKIQGSSPQIIKINSILNSLIDHYHKFGKVTNDQVKDYLNKGEDAPSSYIDQLESDVLVFGTRGSRIAPKTPNQKRLVESSNKNDLVFAIGPAGTGKTYISVALAVRALKNKDVKKIIITRPAVEAGETLGFLPGDLKDKVDPYLRPIYDALHDMIPSEKLKYFFENGIVEIAPLAYMRGRTLNNAFILLDESQNTTPIQMKMFLTRMGPYSKAIVTGDKSQIDLPRNQKSGLVEALAVLKNVDGIDFVYLDGDDVVRHKVVKNIIKAYNQFNEQSKEKNT